MMMMNGVKSVHFYDLGSMTITLLQVNIIRITIKLLSRDVYDQKHKTVSAS